MFSKALALAAVVASAQAFAPAFTPGLAAKSSFVSASSLATPKMRLQSAGRPKARQGASSLAMEFLAPPEIYQAVANAGEAKSKLPVWKTFYMGILAGIYIAFGSCLAMTVGGACQGLVAAGNLGLQKIILGAFGLPFGLLMVVCAGGELLTGNAAFMTAALAEKKINMGDLLKNWVVSYAGNIVGSIFLAWLVFASGALAAPSVATVKAISVAKTSGAFLPLMYKGILCNWLVCMGLWQATGAKDIASKAIAIWFPISAFVTMGFEHSVANMFFIPTGIFQGAEGVTWAAFFINNLIPVTLGNIIAGSLFVAGSYALVFGRLGKGKDA